MVYQLLQDILVHHHLDRHLSRVVLILRFYQVVQHLAALLNDKRNRPSEEVHEIWKQIGMWTLDELLNVQSIVLRLKGEVPRIL